MSDPAASTRTTPNASPPGSPGAPGPEDAGRLREAVASLRAILEHEPAGAEGPWRWQVRRGLAGVRDALVAEGAGTQDGWLAARSGRADRSRHPLLRQVGELAGRLLEDAETPAVRHDLARLAVDLDHHAQRRRDLAYDEVEMELGGSE